jgi:hypothetical protein
MGGKNSSEKSRDRNSIFDSGVCRIHAVKWLFPQEKATLDALVMSTSEAKMLYRTPPQWEWIPLLESSTCHPA